MTHWLTILGIGADGADGLADSSRRRLREASLLVGGARHLAMAAPLAPDAETRLWSRPIEATFPSILECRPRPVVVLASGDPFLHGVGSHLAPFLTPGEWDAIPAPSALSLASGRLGWALDAVAVVSLCGRPPETLIPFLQPRRRILVLSADATTPARVAALLRARGGLSSRIHLMERLGAPDERIRLFSVRDFDPGAVDPLNLVALELDEDVAALPIAPGFDDAFFETEGPITTPELRALAIAALAPHTGEHLWDVGAGSGSVAIEWLLRDPLAMEATAFERDGYRAIAIGRNARALGTPRLRIVGGEAPAAFQGEAVTPDAIFVGGGGRFETLEAGFQRLRTGGRMVAHSVTIETDMALAEAERRWGGQLLRVSIERAGPLGGFRGYRPSMTVTQWSTTKP